VELVTHPMEIGITDRVWGVADLLALTDAYLSEQKTQGTENRNRFGLFRTCQHMRKQINTVLR
jgi:hypothetical protein